MPSPRTAQIERLMVLMLESMKPLQEESTADELLSAMLSLADHAVGIVLRTKGDVAAVRTYLQDQLLRVTDKTTH